MKGAFKDVMKEIKSLNDEQVTEFVRTGKMTLLGKHEVGPEDLRIMYSFDATKVSKEMAEKYEAHSDDDILILLDCTPDQVLFLELA